jgi:DNA-binding ferritin-like protein
MFATENDLPLGTRTKVVKLGDAAAADLFTGIARDVDKQLWFLEAHRHAKR